MNDMALPSRQILDETKKVSDFGIYCCFIEDFRYIFAD